MSIEVASTNLSTNMIWIEARKKLATDSRLIENSDSPSSHLVLVFTYTLHSQNLLKLSLVIIFFSAFTILLSISQET